MYENLKVIAMTHLTGPLLWTVAFYDLQTTYLTKMARNLYQQKHLQLCLYTTSLCSLLLTTLFCFLSTKIPNFYFGFLVSVHGQAPAPAPAAVVFG